MIAALAMLGALIGPAVGAAEDARAPGSALAGFVGQAFFGSDQPVVDFSRRQDWLAGLSVSGYFLNTSGMWLDSSSLAGFGRQAGEHHGANSLAVERELLQLDANYRLNADNSLFLRSWMVYEPPYPWEAGTIAGPDGVFDKSQSQIYNRYDVREAYWKTVNGPLTLFSGRQIVTWGESLAFRVGDVVNPQDLSWNFGFANLEQSRLPLWMLHPLLSLPELGRFQSTFLEGIWAPPWQPLYGGIDYADHRYVGQGEVAGSVNLLPPSGGRFDAYPYPFLTPALTPPGRQAAFPQLLDSAPPSVSFRLPGDTFSNSVGGLRLHTIFEDAEATWFYWRGHQFSPTPFVDGRPISNAGTIKGQNLQLRYPDFDDLGATINRPLYLNETFLSEIPLVLRAEGVWQDRTPFNTLSLKYPSATARSPTLNTLVALDVDQMAVPRLSATGPLTLNLEWNNYTILSPRRDFVYGGYAERWRHNEENVLFGASTSWWWGSIAPDFVGIYNPDGTTFLLFPSVTVTPPWTNRYSMMLQYIGVVSNDRYGAYAGGVFKGKSMLLMELQYNFDLISGRTE